MRRTRDYDASLIESLRDPEEAAAYIAAVKAEHSDGDPVLAMALENVRKAQKENST